MMYEVNLAKKHIHEKHGANPAPGTYPVPYKGSRGPGFMKVVITKDGHMNDFTLFKDEALTKEY